MTAVILLWGGVVALLVTLATGVARFRRSPRLAYASAALLLLLVFGLVGEAAVRIYHWRAFGIPLAATMLMYNDPELGWPGIAVMGDPSSPRPKILAVGDSFSTPGYVPEPEMYYSVLGHLLEAEIFAYGAGGYGTLQELLVLERYLPQVQPDLVLLQVHNNDFINNSWELERASYFNNNLMTRPYLLDGVVVHRFPTRFSGASLFLRMQARLVYELTIGVQRVGAALSQAGILRSVEHDVWRDGLAFPPFRRAVDTTDELVARIKRRAAPTPVVAFHAEWDDGSAFFASWRAIFRRHEIHFCDDIGSSVRLAEVRGATLRAPDGAHWNAAGHAIAGRALAECLRPLTPRRTAPAR